METFLIDVPMPSMGATVSELTVVSLRVGAGDRVTRGQKVAELESDKSVFEFETLCDGVVREVFVRPGEVRAAGSPFMRIETSDPSVRHLEAKAAPGASGAAAPISPGAASAAGPAAALVWTPKALKLAQEAGLDPARVADIVPTGPGGRVSGDDVAGYLARKKA